MDRQNPSIVGGSVDGAVLAIPVRMKNRIAPSRVGALRSLSRVVRGLAEGSLVVLGFGLAMLVIGTPLALLTRGIHEGLSWLVALRGGTSALVEAFVSVSSVLGTVIVIAVFVRLLVAFFEWRRRFVIGSESGTEAAERHESRGTGQSDFASTACVVDVHWRGGPMTRRSTSELSAILTISVAGTPAFTTTST